MCSSTPTFHCAEYNKTTSCVKKETECSKMTQKCETLVDKCVRKDKDGVCLKKTSTCASWSNVCTGEKVERCVRYEKVEDPKVCIKYDLAC